MARAAPWLAAILLPAALADLPVHCLHHQVLGAWELELGAPTESRTPDCTEWAGKGNSVERFFGFLDYKRQSNGAVHSLCTRMSTGWWHSEDGSGAGCLRGKLIAPAAAASSTAFVEEGSQPAPAAHRRGRGRVPSRRPAGDWEASRWPVTRPSIAPKFARHASRKASRLRRAHKAAASVAAARVAPPKWTWPFHAAQLPAAFDWRNVSGTNFLDHIPMRTQGECGSCYAIAAVDMASARLRIASGNRVRAPLSPQDAMDCSRFTQGCEGGFPFSTGKTLREGGVRTERCSAYAGRDITCPAPGLCPSLSAVVDDASADTGRPSRSERAMHAAAASATVFAQTAAHVGPAVGPAAPGPAPEQAAGSGYAAHQRLWRAGAPRPGPADRVRFGDYRYIGGFYGACSEPEMRAELFHKGPIAATIFSPNSLRYYRRGVFTHNVADSARARAQDRARPTLAGTPQGSDPHTPGDVAPSAVRRANATQPGRAGPGAEPGDDGNVLEYRHEWEEATHSVLVVGWGVSRRGVPYWSTCSPPGSPGKRGTPSPPPSPPASPAPNQLHATSGVANGCVAALCAGGWRLGSRPDASNAVRAMRVGLQGMKGYFFIRRGQDECAIESMAVALDPLLPAPL